MGSDTGAAASDSLGKYRLFVFGSLLSMVMVFFYTNLGQNPIWVVVVINTALWVGISSRMISSSALISGVPEMKDRGAYMGINSSIQQVSGGVASFVSGLIVYQPTKSAPLQHFDTVGYVTMGSMAITMMLMYFISRQVAEKLQATGGERWEGSQEEDRGFGQCGVTSRREG